MLVPRLELQCPTLFSFLRNINHFILSISDHDSVIYEECEIFYAFSIVIRLYIIVFSKESVSDRNENATS